MTAERVACSRLFVTALVGGLALSCASSSMTPLGAPAYPKPPNCAFDVYMSEQEVGVPSRTLCMLEATSGSTMIHNRSVQGAINELRPKACQCGADAIVLVNAQTIGGTFMGGAGQGSLVAKGIQYLGDPGPGGPPPPPQQYGPPPPPGQPYGPPPPPGQPYGPPPAPYPPQSGYGQPPPGPGAELGPCYQNGACNRGLVCDGAGVCVRPARR
jgi:hypothetical protein